MHGSVRYPPILCNSSPCCLIPAQEITMQETDTRWLAPDYAEVVRDQEIIRFVRIYKSCVIMFSALRCSLLLCISVPFCLFTVYCGILCVTLPHGFAVQWNWTLICYSPPEKDYMLTWNPLRTLTDMDIFLQERFQSSCPLAGIFIRHYYGSLCRLEQTKWHRLTAPYPWTPASNLVHRV